MEQSKVVSAEKKLTPNTKELQRALSKAALLASRLAKAYHLKAPFSKK